VTFSTHPSGYRVGAATVTTDGELGTVCALVVDPATRTITHLAVEPRHRHHQARLVPTEMATAEPGGDVRIACDRDGFDQLDELEHYDIVDLGPYDPHGLYGPDDFDGVGGVTGGMQQLGMWTDRPPQGEAALRHRTPVQAGEHTVGYVDGLLAGADGRITAVMVASGHLWAHRTVAVPVEAVTGVGARGLTIAGSWEQFRRRP
jgi:sporulation protein YlmC with PRC-barrel domain